MWVQVLNLVRYRSLTQQFMLASLLILVSGVIVIGWWVGRQIEAGVVSRTAATTALYVDSFIAPHLQELGDAEALSPGPVAALGGLLVETPLGQEIVAFKVWDAGGRILHSTSPGNIGRAFPISPGVAQAWRGRVAARISDLREDENALEREHWTQLLEVYIPVRLEGTNRIIAVAEFYQTVDALQTAILAAQLRSWLVVGIATLAMYALLAGMVRRASDTIVRQQAESSDQVARLTTLLAQNDELHARVRRAGTRTTTLNERFLRRISAELHDGPAQDLGLALLRLDNVIARCGACPLPRSEGGHISEDLDAVQTSLRHALQDVRAISAGLRLPELDGLTLGETLHRVVRAHERRTGTRVALRLDGVPEQASLPIKITLYRLTQEALSNAYRHGGGVGQEVAVRYEPGNLRVEVADRGPGFYWEQAVDRNEHLGLADMRERVERAGGHFRIDTRPGWGTRVVSQLPLHQGEGGRER